MIQVLETKEDFKNLLASTDKLVVIDFFAEWCGPCRNIAPKIKELSETYTDVVFAKVDVDINGETSEECGISAMPTFKFYKNEKEVQEIVGANAAKIEEAIKALK